MNTILYTLLALFAFAGNSVLCRLALGDNAIDASSFTAVRLLSGIIVLALIVRLKQTETKPSQSGSWKASFMLFMYAVTFSYAYVSLETGVGALILFGAVQMTMILSGVLSGNKLHIFEWLGVLLAFAGFAYLVLPTVTTPSVSGFILMLSAGVAWGLYTLQGRGSLDPLADTASNFYRTLPAVVILVAFSFRYSALSQYGIMLAVLSGGLTSALGYAIWYSALRGLSAIQAAVVQLFVPVIASIGGVLFAGEVLSLHLVISSSIIISGILIVIVGRQYLILK